MEGGLLALVAFSVAGGSPPKEPMMATEARQHALAVFQESVAPYGALHRLSWKSYIESRGRDGWLSALLQQYHAVRAMQPLLSLAGDLAAAQPELRDYADWAHRCAEEEQPHADWFREDLLALGVSEETIRTAMPEREILCLLGVQFSLVVSVHPAALLGYLYTAGTHPASPGTLAALTARLDVPAAGLRTLLYQAEIEAERGTEVRELVKRFACDPLCFEAMLTSAALFLCGWSRLFRRKSRVSPGECDG
jgi:hypothetical protein